MRKRPGLRNYQVIPDSGQDLETLRSGKWKHYDEENIETLTIQGRAIRVRAGLTFTPYANPTLCNAHCRFCSEELSRKNQTTLTAQRVIKDYPRYFEGLRKALADLATLRQVGLSLSGLEATSDPILVNSIAPICC